MTKVSVIIPTHNRCELLQLAVRSVLSQRFDDFEIVIVDDNSKDNTRRQLSTLSDSRIKYVRHQINKGVAAARNTGIRTSAGEYIAFLDDDDEWLPEKLGEQIAILECRPPLIGAVYSGATAVDAATREVLYDLRPTERGDIFNHVLTYNHLTVTSTIIVRRKCFETVGIFDESLLYGEDYDMWLRIAKEFHFDFISKPLVKFSVHSGAASLSGNYGNYEAVIRSIENQFIKHGRFLQGNRRAQSLRYLALGDLYSCLGDIRNGRNFLWKAMKLQPGNIKHYYNLALSLFGAKNFKRFKETKNQLTRALRARLNRAL